MIKDSIIKNFYNPTVEIKNFLDDLETLFQEYKIKEFKSDNIKYDGNKIELINVTIIGNYKED